MIKLNPRLLALALVAAPFVTAQSPEWGQCGGIGWTGPTTCVSGTVCTEQNSYYSQCLPGAASSSVPAQPTTPPATTASPTPAPTSTAPPAPAPTGFVKTSGQSFTLNGDVYTVVGANAYWVGLMGYSTSDMNKAFADIAATGATTVRTWGFNEVTTASGDYYHLWSGSTATVNTGATGLENFDNVVAAAKANGLRLIVTLTNNWSDYGGMDVYVQQILGSPDHDLFYTNSEVISAYQSYVKTFVSRYLDEPGILAWELANEPRCTGSTGTSTGTCTTKTITQWIETMSAFVKSIDSNHLVAVGDEGFFNDPTSSDYPYQGGEGIDFNANLNISTIDFGTLHLYPQSWGESSPSTWGSQWITDHATSQKAANKPVIVEEFGSTTDQEDVYTAWYSTIISSGLTGDLIWQAGSDLTNGETPQDGYAIYPGTDVYTLDTQHAAALKARNG
ncbi:carbohydrate-binding module family 1 protein/glycoside hydrolase family 5 protein [Gelatoporia subvermispora B]|uniref:mannan endo-1,4-beta-mannosidase n=1 Tax=Ceriporiopsis subvermispora (strain B) TaxID=914234 RepID=M2QZW4_CERS8|nr:carbohydrate-binding module family 1 protein/glycoside hydrolase family 5 protein [Gelatoporia subvermispora B]